jgi:hypothetical protein
MSHLSSIQRVKSPDEFNNSTTSGAPACDKRVLLDISQPSRCFRRPIASESFWKCLQDYRASLVAPDDFADDTWNSA